MNRYTIDIGQGSDDTFYLYKNGEVIANRTWIHELLYIVANHEAIILPKCESESHMLAILQDWGVRVGVVGL